MSGRDRDDSALRRLELVGFNAALPGDFALIPRRSEEGKYRCVKRPRRAGRQDQFNLPKPLHWFPGERPAQDALGIKI
jgi:hypothetical protein